MSALIGQLGWTLLHFVWQGALVACVAGLGLVALRNSRPQARYALACAALLACMAWPVADLVVRLAAPAAAQGDGAVLLSRAAPGLPGGAGPLEWLRGHLQTIVFGWACCAAALSLRLVAGLWWIGRAADGKRAGAALQASIAGMARQFGITRTVQVRIVDSIASPITAGWWRPLLLLPSALLTGMPAELLEALIAHELGHVKRYDYLVNLLQNVAEMLLFYHPAVWWLSHRIRIEREHIADDLAAAHVGKRRLALALSELEKIQFSHPELALAANGGDLMSRIKRLVRPAQQQSRWKAALPVLGLSIALASGCAQLPPTSTSTAPQPVREKALARFGSCVKPMYPKQELRDGVTGTVKMLFLVDTDGKVIDSRVDRTSGSTSLDETARIAIAKCMFKPASENGVPVQDWVPVQYVWTLK
ncbi:MAG: peptidase [Massilia sp.]|nr:peptidase [Massilia sp.]